MTTHQEYSRDSYPANKYVLQKVKGVKGHLLCRIYWATNLKDRVCRMGLKRLGGEIGFDPSTASRAGKALVEDGYIVKMKEADLTKSEPPHYKVTQKFFDLLQNDIPPIAQNNSPIAERKTPIAERKQEKETEKDLKTTNSGGGGGGDNYKKVVNLYEQNIGLLSPLIAEMVKEDADTYPYPIIEEAVRIALAANVRKWSYVRGALRRMAANGYQQPQANGSANPTEGFYTDLEPETNPDAAPVDPVIQDIVNGWAQFAFLADIKTRVKDGKRILYGLTEKQIYDLKRAKVDSILAPVEFKAV